MPIAHAQRLRTARGVPGYCTGARADRLVCPSLQDTPGPVKRPPDRATAMRFAQMAQAPTDGHHGVVTHHHLLPHPRVSRGPVESITARVFAVPPQALILQFVLRGDLHRVRVPAESDGGRADALWRHTCFEAFVRRADDPGYLELNFAPSGRWQAYQFAAYRDGMTPADLPQPVSITVGQRERVQAAAASPAAQEDALALEALVYLPVPDSQAGRELRLALSAIVEDETGTLSYWALRHAPGRPDFHHPDAFALTLAWT